MTVESLFATPANNHDNSVVVVQTVSAIIGFTPVVG